MLPLSPTAKTSDEELPQTLLKLVVVPMVKLLHELPS